MKTSRLGLLKNVLFLASAALFLIAVLWFAVTQPIIFSGAPSTNTVTVSAARLATHVRTLSESFFPRDWKHPENLDRASAYIRAEFEQANGTVSEQPYQMEGKTYRNVIAAFGPDTAERIIVGAHYDAAGEFPGADDNASGVAGLIELAYLLGKTTLPMRVDLVAYTLEEARTLDGRGLLRTEYGGSAVHAASLKERGIPVRIMFSLEMIGFFSDAENSQGYPFSILRLFYPSRGNFIVVIGRLREGWAVRRVKKAMWAASPLPVYSFNVPSFVAGIDRSDHSNYWKTGYPALMITDTSFNRNEHYHTSQDTPDRLDYSRMAMVVQGVYNAVLEHAR